MNKILHPAVYSFVASFVGVLLTTGYITPKGLDAITSFLTGAVLLAISVVASHWHHADVTRAKLSQGAGNSVASTTQPTV